MREKDLNLQPSGYEPDELPDCSIPPRNYSAKKRKCDNFFRFEQKINGQSGAPPLEQDGGNLGEEQDQGQDEKLNRYEREETAVDVKQPDFRRGDGLQVKRRRAERRAQK